MQDIASLASSLVCSSCHQGLIFSSQFSELVCELCELAFPVKNGIPVMLLEEARGVIQPQLKVVVS
jgi:uncharacterized protein YbaR (Trm112 family)